MTHSITQTPLPYHFRLHAYCPDKQLSVVAKATLSKISSLTSICFYAFEDPILKHPLLTQQKKEFSHWYIESYVNAPLENLKHVSHVCIDLVVPKSHSGTDQEDLKWLEVADAVDVFCKDIFPGMRSSSFLLFGNNCWFLFPNKD